MLIEELRKRGIPDFMPASAAGWPERRKKILDILQREEYGYLPPACKVSFEVTKVEKDLYGGKGTRTDAALHCELPNREFVFPATALIPKSACPVPAVLLISFANVIPSKNLPAEELLDNGIAVFTFYYGSVVPDNADAFNAELPRILFGDRRGPSDPGTIAMWAWGASRVMDWAMTFDTVQKDHIAVVGQSRLGKTALFAGAMDERFAIAYSNDSGCCGAALSRGKIGEHFSDITGLFPYWFCENFLKYSDGNEDGFPMDQDALLASVAPRMVYVASSEEDTWSDPRSEYLSVVSASRIWELLGRKGVGAPDRYLQANEALHNGDIGYHVRSGTHTLNRDDWHYFLSYLKAHL